MIKLNWKQRIVLAIGTALFHMFLLWTFDVFTDEKLYTLNSLLFQGVAFGILMSIGYPYLNNKLGKRFRKKSKHNT